MKEGEMAVQILRTTEESKKLRVTLKDCVNELCLLCGDYKQEYLGACDGCRWKEVKAEVREQ